MAVNPETTSELKRKRTFIASWRKTCDPVENDDSVQMHSGWVGYKHPIKSDKPGEFFKGTHKCQKRSLEIRNPTGGAVLHTHSMVKFFFKEYFLFIDIFHPCTYFALCAKNSYYCALSIISRQRTCRNIGVLCGFDINIFLSEKKRRKKRENPRQEIR